MSTRPYTFTFAAAGAGKLVTSRGTFWRVMSTSSPVDIAAFAEGREIARFSGAVTGTAWESLDERGISRDALASDIEVISRAAALKLIAGADFTAAF